MDVVVMSAEIAADRAANLILNIKRINKDKTHTSNCR